MSVFTGTYYHSLDQKNRLFIPTKLREYLGESFMLYKPQNGDKCLFVYTTKDWEYLSNQLNNQPASKELTLKQRFTYLRLDTVETDKQGRITIKADFCKFANLEKEVVIQGIGGRIEIWNRTAFDEMVDEREALIEEAGEQDEDIKVNLAF